MTELKLEPLFKLRLDLQTPIDVGDAPDGHRLVGVFSGGEFRGPRLSGTVVPQSGADWPRLRADGSLNIDVRVCLKTHDGAVIYMTYGGRMVAESTPKLMEALDLSRVPPVDPSTYYLRIFVLFETGDERYKWVNGIVAAGSGVFGNGGVDYEVSQLA